MGRHVPRGFLSCSKLLLLNKMLIHTLIRATIFLSVVHHQEGIKNCLTIISRFKAQSCNPWEGRSQADALITTKTRVHN